MTVARALAWLTAAIYTAGFAGAVALAVRRPGVWPLPLLCGICAIGTVIRAIHLTHHRQETP